MFAFLPSTEEIIRVDGRMSKSIRGLEEVPVVPTTSHPVRAGEELYLYIAVSQAAVSAALVRNDGRSQ